MAMASGSTTLQHQVHKGPEEHSPRDAANPPEIGLGLPPTLGGRAISPNGHSGAEGVSSMASVNWGMPATPASPMMVPTFPTKATGNPVVIASSGIRVPDKNNSNATAPTFSIGSNNPPSPRSSNTSSRRGKGGGGASAKTREGGAVNNRRQKRLERNRESARLSRRRRKQYLEVLEDRVTKLSLEMDKGRREHVAVAHDTIKTKRAHILANGGAGVHLLCSQLSRTSNELRVAATFQTQQLHSLSLPPSVKFLLWLSLQNDSYFRGGRAASERLSAARIGERMLTSGNDKVPPSHGMWPLFCNEVCLSYDQEERVRNFQSLLLQSHASWVHRHAGAASKLAMDSTHDALQATLSTVGQRERSVLGCLTDEQKVKFLGWASKNTDKLARLKQNRSVAPKQESSVSIPEISDEHHVAANLYILHHRMQRIRHSLPPASRLVSSPSLKRLSRRPSFESLGSTSASDKNNKDSGNRPLSREVSFSSEGSLKRSLDDMSSIDQEDDERHTVHNINPEDAQTAAGPAIEAALGFIKELVPPPKPTPKATPDPVMSTYAMPSAFKTPLARQPMAPQPEAPQSYSQQQTIPQAFPSSGGNALAAPEEVHVTVSYNDDPQTNITSFLPPNLNVVPEEGFLAGGSGTAEDFLFDLTEEDWAIGAGLDMDTT